MAGLLVLLIFVGPLLFVPVGLAVLIRSRGPLGRVAGGALLVLGAGCAFTDVQYAKCNEVPDPCGAPDWVASAVAIGMLAAATVLVACALAVVVSRLSRSRPAP